MKTLKFDAKPNYDPKNEMFPALDSIESTRSKVKSRLWYCEQWLYQNGSYGCAAYGTEHNWISQINIHNFYYGPVIDSEVQEVYRKAQLIDQWKGKEPEIKGTSVVACMKVLKAQGKINSYQHAFGMRELKQVISNIGPAVVTIPWFKKMSQPDLTGLVRIAGKQVGWHALLVRGLDAKNQHFILRQSYGKDHGLNGDIKITFKAMDLLLKMGGTICLAKL